MIIEYDTNVVKKKTIATGRGEDGQNKFQLMIFPMKIYADRSEDHKDPFVPYTLEAYYYKDFIKELCSSQIISEHETISSHFAEAMNTLILQTPYRSIFGAVEDVMYGYYWDKIAPHLFSIPATGSIFLNDEEMRSEVQHWPNFIKRFGHRKMSLIMKQEYRETYAGTWWNVDKPIKG